MKFPEKVDKIAYCGDWHGNTHWATHILRELGNQGVKVVIHLGDYGYRFEADYLAAQSQILEGNDMLLLFVDGNHDDHAYLEGIPVSLDETRKVSDHIWHLPRGFRWEWAGVRFLALGGAVSVDKWQRVPGFSWWDQEAVTHSQAQRIINDGETDVVVAHDAPFNSKIPRFGFLNLPEDIQREADQHRDLLQSVAEAITPTFWWHGHYHVNYQDVIEFDDGQECQVAGLDCDGSTFTDNVDIVDIDAIKSLVEFHKGVRDLAFSNPSSPPTASKHPANGIGCDG